MRDRICACCMAGLLVMTAAVIPRTVGNESEVRIRLEEIMQAGGIENDSLYQWAGIATDCAGSVYLTDMLDYSLKKLDAQGRLIKARGRKGQGPGEFLAPRLLEYQEGFLYATDQNIPGLQIFTDDLSFQRRIGPPYLVEALEVLSGGLIAVVVLDYRERGKIWIVDHDGAVKRKVTYEPDPSENMIMDMIDLEADRQGNIFVSYVFRDRIMKLDHRGNLVWSKKILGIQKIKKKKAGSFTLPAEVVYKDIALDGEGRIYVLGGSFSEHKGRDVYVLDSAGTLISTFTLPEQSHCIHIDCENSLFARADEGVTLKKYRMHFIRKSP